MFEMKCKQCGREFRAKDENDLFHAAKAHFHREHAFLPIPDKMFKENVKEHAKMVK